jgi:hypothetical protein
MAVTGTASTLGKAPSAAKASCGCCCCLAASELHLTHWAWVVTVLASVQSHMCHLLRLRQPGVACSRGPPQNWPAVMLPAQPGAPRKYAYRHRAGSAPRRTGSSAAAAPAATTAACGTTGCFGSSSSMCHASISMSGQTGMKLVLQPYACSLEHLCVCV